MQLGTMDARTVIAIIVTLAALGVLLILISEGVLFNSSKKTSTPHIIIAGPSNSGKTSLYLQWTNQKAAGVVPSQTSNYFNTFRLPVGSKDPLPEMYTLVDVPGHPRLQHLLAQELEKTRNNLICIIFMIDAAGGQSAFETAAKQLYNLLKLTEKRAGGVDILVAANKFDIFNVISVKRLQDTLEKNIDVLRDSDARGVSEVHAENEEEGEGSWIGGNGDFKFTQLEGSVIILDGSVHGDKTGKWQEFVEERALNRGS